MKYCVWGGDVLFTDSRLDRPCWVSSHFWTAQHAQAAAKVSCTNAPQTWRKSATGRQTHTYMTFYIYRDSEEPATFWNICIDMNSFTIVAQGSLSQSVRRRTERALYREWKRLAQATLEEAAKPMDEAPELSTDGNEESEEVKKRANPSKGTTCHFPT